MAKQIRYRCEVCGATSAEPKECCGEEMVDLLSSGCMACKGCGHH